VDSLTASRTKYEQIEAIQFKVTDSTTPSRRPESTDSHFFLGGNTGDILVVRLPSRLNRGSTRQFIEPGCGKPFPARDCPSSAAPNFISQPSASIVRLFRMLESMPRVSLHLIFGRKFGELHIHPAAPHEGDDPG